MALAAAGRVRRRHVATLTVALVLAAYAHVSTAAEFEKGFIADEGGEQVCYSCPHGAACQGNSQNPEAAPGYWAEKGSYSEFHQCTNKDEACLGGPDSKCAKGYHGRLCTQCDKGHFRSAGRCFPCPGTALTVLNILVICVVIQGAVELFPWFASGDRALNTLSLSMNYLQVIAVYVDFNVEWPGAATKTYGAFQWSQLKTGIASPECAIPASRAVRSFVVLLLPVFFIVFFIFMYIRVWLWNKIVARFSDRMKIRHPALFKPVDPEDGLCRKITKFFVNRWSRIRNMQHCKEYFINGYLYFLYFMYMPLSMETLQIWDCTKWESGVWTLDSDASVHCFTMKGQWPWMASYGMVFFLLYPVGIPVLFFIILSWNRNNLANETTKRKYCAIYFRFEANYYWWELVIMSRKLGVSIAALYFTENPEVQVWMACATLGIATMMQVSYRPFLKDINDRLERQLLLCALICIFSGFLFNDREFKVGTWPRFFLQVAIMGIIVYSFLLIIRMLWRETKQESWMGFIDLVDAKFDEEQPALLKYYNNIQLRWIVAEFFNKRYHYGIRKFLDSKEANAEIKSTLRNFMVELNQVRERLLMDYERKSFPMLKYFRLHWMPPLVVYMQHADEAKEREVEAAFSALDLYIKQTKMSDPVEALKARRNSWIHTIVGRRPFGGDEGQAPSLDDSIMDGDRSTDKVQSVRYAPDLFDEPSETRTLSQAEVSRRKSKMQLSLKNLKISMKDFALKTPKTPGLSTNTSELPSEYSPNAARNDGLHIRAQHFKGISPDNSPALSSANPARNSTADAAGVALDDGASSSSTESSRPGVSFAGTDKPGNSGDTMKVGLLRNDYLQHSAFEPISEDDEMERKQNGDGTQAEVVEKKKRTGSKPRGSLFKNLKTFWEADRKDTEETNPPEE